MLEIRSPPVAAVIGVTAGGLPSTDIDVPIGVPLH